MRRAPLLLLIVLATCSASRSKPKATKSGELPVTRAVLYQNGIGYLERRGTVADNQLRIRVRPEQIPDVLKSLTVVDLGSGRPISIALPIEKSRAQQLADLPEQVRTQGGLLALAQAFRGARCSVETGDDEVKGRLVGVENLGTVEEDGEMRPDWRLSVLSDGGALRQIAVAEIRALHVLDGALKVGLRKALEAALDAGAWKPVDLVVRLAGRGPHEVVVSYVVEMPAWKPAYRVVVGKDRKALLQGWAVVDNVSGDDWRDVSLSLTAGTPLAFTYDLYTPRIPRRPNLSPKEPLAQIPLEAFQTEGGIPAAEESVAERSQLEEREMPPPSATPAPMAQMAPSAPRRETRAKKMMRDGYAPPQGASPVPVSADSLERNFKTLVAGSTVGSLFRYDLEEPVTIHDRHSALVNIVNAKVAGEEVLLFRVGSDGVSPYRAVRFKNDSGSVLESGPMAIYQSGDAGGTFLGEALAQRIEKGANTFVPYAQDGRVRVTLAEEEKEQGVTLVKMVRGMLSIEAKRITRFRYDVDNGSGDEVTLFVRRDRRPGWKLNAKDEVIEEGGAYYLPIKLAKSGRTRVEVEEQTPVQRTVDIFSDLGRQAVAVFLGNGSVDPKIAAQLKEALELRDRCGTLDARVSELEEQRAMQAQRESEVRDNLKVLGKASSNADLKARLEQSLAELEKQLNEVTRKLVAASMERSEARERLAALVKTIALE